MNEWSCMREIFLTLKFYSMEPNLVRWKYWKSDNKIISPFLSQNILWTWLDVEQIITSELLDDRILYNQEPFYNQITQNVQFSDN